jgi:hypothetical protein
MFSTYRPDIAQSAAASENLGPATSATQPESLLVKGVAETVIYFGTGLVAAGVSA